MSLLSPIWFGTLSDASLTCYHKTCLGTPVYTCSSPHIMKIMTVNEEPEIHHADTDFGL